MKRIAQLLLPALLLCVGCSRSAPVVPANLRHLDPKVLGAAIESDIERWLPAEPGAIEPSVSYLAEGGRYQSFTLRYPKRVGFEPARAALNRLYGAYEGPKVSPGEALWRIRAERLAIKLSEEDDAIEAVYTRIAEPQ